MIFSFFPFLAEVKMLFDGAFFQKFFFVYKQIIWNTKRQRKRRRRRTTIRNATVALCLALPRWTLVHSIEFFFSFLGIVTLSHLLVSLCLPSCLSFQHRKHFDQLRSKYECHCVWHRWMISIEPRNSFSFSLVFSPKMHKSLTMRCCDESEVEYKWFWLAQQSQERWQKKKKSMTTIALRSIAIGVVVFNECQLLITYLRIHWCVCFKNWDASGRDWCQWPQNKIMSFVSLISSNGHLQRERKKTTNKQATCAFFRLPVAHQKNGDVEQTINFFLINCSCICAQKICTWRESGRKMLKFYEWNRSVKFCKRISVFSFLFSNFCFLFAHAFRGTHRMSVAVRINIADRCV